MTTQNGNFDYAFEYTDRNGFLKLLGLCLGLLLVLLFSIKFTKDYINVGVSIMISFLFPVLVFWLNRKKIKKQGFANITNNSVEFHLANLETKINFSDIQNYIVQHYNGVYFKVKFLETKKIIISANENFCNPENFEVFCDEFERVLERERKNKNLQFVRKKTFFEKKWVFVFLISVTILLVAGLIRALFTGIRSYSSLFVTIGILASMWTGYFTAQAKAKNRQE